MKKVLIINANPKANSMCKSMAGHYASIASVNHEVAQINIGDME